MLEELFVEEMEEKEEDEEGAARQEEVLAHAPQVFKVHLAAKVRVVWTHLDSNEILRRIWLMTPVCPVCLYVLAGADAAAAACPRRLLASQVKGNFSQGGQQQPNWQAAKGWLEAHVLGSSSVRCRRNLSRPRDIFRAAVFCTGAK